jgi:hypothetical protein
MKQQLNRQICTTVNRRTESHCGISWEGSCNRDPSFRKQMTNHNTSLDQRSDSRTDSLTSDP